VLAGKSPAVGREVLDAAAQALELVLLGVRVSDGLSLAAVSPEGLAALPDLVAQGLVDGGQVHGGRIVLTRRGRLLADAVVRALVP